MKQSADKTTKKPGAFRPTLPAHHAAVRPVHDHESPHTSGKGFSGRSRDLSQVPLNSAAPSSISTNHWSSCPFSPQRCPFGGACHTCPPRVQATQAAQVQRKAANSHELGQVPPIVNAVLRSPGRKLDAGTRAYMESRFGRDLSNVRVHHDGQAAASARAVNAQAYTVGRNVVFGHSQYAPDTIEGRKLLAHELAHTLQQGAAAHRPDLPLSLDAPTSGSEMEAERAVADIAANQASPAPVLAPAPYRIARLPCTSPSICSTPVPGSAEDFNTQEEQTELGPRARRRRMTPARAVSGEHAGHARQLEIFLNDQAFGRMSNIQGIFLDADMSPDTEAMVWDCSDWVAEALPSGSPTPPGMGGATKDCAFVHGRLNQEALAFNTTRRATIGGISREEWRVETLQTLTHETEHPRFDTATSGRARPSGVTTATCTRSNVESELSELAAIMSEFPAISRSAAAEANPSGPMHSAMNTWFQDRIFNSSESINGALLKMGCSCDCPEVDAFVRDTFDEATNAGAWSLSEKNDFNARVRSELVGPVRPIWPL
jgi:hypothetical protein